MQPSDQIVTVQRATELAAQLRINLTKVGGMERWQFGVQHERDKLQLFISLGMKVDAGVDLDVMAAKAALHELQRWPDWYERIKSAEDRAIKYWRNIP